MAGEKMDDQGRIKTSEIRRKGRALPKGGGLRSRN